MISPGEIYYADLDDAGPHPVIVISRPDLNRGNYVLCVVCTSANVQRRRHLANCVVFDSGESGFTKETLARCDTLLTLRVSQLDLADGPLGVVDDERHREIIRAIGYVNEAECEPV